jgi:carboxypeptidase C (cathepsin A)
VFLFQTTSKFNPNMPKIVAASILLTFFLIQTAFIKAQTPSPTPAASPRPAQIEESPVVTKHSIRAGNRQLDYTVTTGLMPLKNREGETEARVFFMAYTLDNVPNPSTRPLMFSFNGGPGSASVWLHLGALGPKRVRMQDDGMMPAPPYELVDNPETWLTETDLVFIDPVGTGYSRVTKQDQAAKFFSVNGDIESIGEFIRLYLTRHERWRSPLFLVGESYGTTRAAGLSNYLFEKGIALNGIALVSTVMNFQTIRFNEGNDLTYALIFPSYAATAWYHKKLPLEMQRKPLREVLREAEDFAAGELTVALAKGDRMNGTEKQRMLDRFAALTGLDKTFVDNSDFRVELGSFNKELLRDRKRTTGRLDSRFTGIDREAGGTNPDFDPSMTAIRPPYTAAFNDYVRRDLGFKSDLEYYILGGGIGQWNWNTNNNYAETSTALKTAMAKNPFMKLFVASGYYDMATPYFAAEHTLATMNLDPQLKRNVTVAYYEAGHMMYIEKNSLEKLKKDVTAFVQNAIKKQ